MSAHTPGPWTWGPKNHGLFGSGQNNEVLSWFPYEGMHLIEGDTAANARLIAAAPDLLVQLRAVTAELESQIARSLHPSKAHIAAWSPHVLDARAAIAKATGAAS